MAHNVSIKEHTAFMRSLDISQAAANRSASLVRSHVAVERKHCISVGHHYDRVERGKCYFCGGNR